MASLRPNMLRTLLVGLMVCGVITACTSNILRESARRGPAVNVDCANANSTACRTDRSIDSVNRTEQRNARKIQGFEYDQDDGEVSGRRKGKGKGYGKLLLYFIGATKATMLYVMIHVVAAVAGKALIVAKVALAIATAIALKKSLEHNDKVSYEIIKHPHHSYIQTHSSSVDYDHDHHGGFGESGFGHRRRRSHR